MVDIKKISEEVLRELEAQEKGAARPCPIQGQGARMRDVTCADVPRRLEHSLLVADMTREKLLAECQVAKQWGVGAVCVAPYYVEEAAQALAVLGYTSAEVSMALKGVDVENLPLEEIIRQSLKKMVK